MTGILATTVASAIESMLGVVDWLLAAVPNPVPSSGQLRQMRGRGVPAVTGPLRRVRRPLLAAIGTVDLLADRMMRMGDNVDLSLEYGPALSGQWSQNLIEYPIWAKTVASNRRSPERTTTADDGVALLSQLGQILRLSTAPIG